jgi:hypothetical protein
MSHIYCFELQVTQFYQYTSKNLFYLPPIFLSKKHFNHPALCFSFDILLRTFLVLFLDAMRGHAHQFKGDNLNS